MKVLYLLVILVIFIAFGRINYRSTRQKADHLVEDIKRFGRQ